MRCRPANADRPGSVPRTSSDAWTTSVVHATGACSGCDVGSTRHEGLLRASSGGPQSLPSVGMNHRPRPTGWLSSRSAQRALCAPQRPRPHGRSSLRISAVARMSERTAASGCAFALRSSSRPTRKDVVDGLVCLRVTAPKFGWGVLEPRNAQTHHRGLSVSAHGYYPTALRFPGDLAKMSTPGAESR